MSASSSPPSPSASRRETGGGATAAPVAEDDIFSVGDVIRVPLAGGVQYVEVALKELPDELEEVQTLLQYEYLPLKYWIQFAVAYYRLKKYEQFETLLKVASSEDTIQALQDHAQDSTAVRPRERIRIQTMLAAYKIKQANNPTLDAAERAEFFDAAEEHLRIADQIENFNPAIHSLSTACKGYRTFMQHATDPHASASASSATFALAAKEFDGALAQMAETEGFLHAELGRAALLFRQAKYADAERIYRSVLRRVPSCPAGVRVALGFCFDRLGKHDLALKAMQRAKAIDPHNEEALVALAILGRQKVRSSSGGGGGGGAGAGGRGLKSAPTPKELRRKYKELLVTANVASTLRCKGSGGLELRNSACLNHLARYISTEWQSEGGIIKGIMSLASGSNVARSTMDLRHTLRKGQLVRIGRYRFVVDPRREITSTEVPLNRPHTGPSQVDLVLEYPKLKESQEFAQLALENTSAAEIKAEAEYYIGRCFHASGDLGKAKEHYHTAVRLAGTQTRRATDGSVVTLGPFALPLLGLAQVSITENRLRKALARLERIHKDYPDVPEVMLRIGFLQVVFNKPRAALPFFKRVAELQVNHRNREGRLIALTLAAEILQTSPHRLKKQEGLGFYEQVLAFHATSIAALQALDEAAAAPSSASSATSSSGHAAPTFVSPEVLANAAALNHDLGRFTEAEKLYAVALRACEVFKDVYPACATVQISVRYNRARLLEEQGDVAGADAAYEALVADHPNYVDGWLRLAMLRGQTRGREAKRELLLKAQRVSEGWPELLGVGVQSSFAVAGSNAAVLLGDLALEEGNLKEAIEHYSKVSQFNVSSAALKTVTAACKAAYAAKQEGGAANAGAALLLARPTQGMEARAAAVARKLNRDAYVGTRIANILWERHKLAVAARQRGAARPEDATVADDILMAYEDALKKCLQHDPGNLFAANGLARALVEKDELDAAQDLLRRVREGSELTDQTPCPSAFINVAHIHMLRGEFNNARVEYERVLARFGPEGTDPRQTRDQHKNLLVFTASACNELASFRDSVAYLEKALAIAPDDPRVVIMLAQTHQKWARHVLLRCQEDPTLVTTAQLERSLASLEIARDKFEWLHGNPRAAEVLPRLQVDNLEPNAAWCEDTLGVAQSNIEAARAHDEEKARLRQEAAEQRRRHKEAAETAKQEREAAKAEAAENVRRLRAERRRVQAEALRLRLAEEAAQRERDALNAEEPTVDLVALGRGSTASKPKRQAAKPKRKAVAATTRRARTPKAPAAKRSRRKAKPVHQAGDDDLFGSSDSDDSDSDGDARAGAGAGALAADAAGPKKRAQQAKAKVDSSSDEDSEDDEAAKEARKAVALASIHGPRTAAAAPPPPAVTATVASAVRKKQKVISDSDDDQEEEEEEEEEEKQAAAGQEEQEAGTPGNPEEDDDEEVVDQSKVTNTEALFDD